MADMMQRVGPGHIRVPWRTQTSVPHTRRQLATVDSEDEHWALDYYTSRYGDPYMNGGCHQVMTLDGN